MTEEEYIQSIAVMLGLSRDIEGLSIKAFLKECEETNDRESFECVKIFIAYAMKSYTDGDVDKHIEKVLDECVGEASRKIEELTEDVQVEASIPQQQMTREEFKAMLNTPENRERDRRREIETKEVHQSMYNAINN